MDDQVAAVLDDRFPGREVDEVRPPGPSWNGKNHTVRVDFDDGTTIYLKVAVDGDATRVARERAAIAYVGANSSIPVPRVVASATDDPGPYLATAPIDGQDFLELWSDAETAERASLAREVGESLARIHAERFDRHGHITGGDADGLDLDTKPWTDVLLDKIGEKREIAPSERFDHHFEEVVVAVEANRDLLDDTPAALLHGDTAKPNCFHTDSGVGFLDWEIAHVGDPARDIVRTRGYLDTLRSDGPEEIVTAFHDGYRDRAGRFPAGFAERRPIYEAVRFLGNSGFYDRLVEFTGESPEEIAAWIEDGMRCRLAAIA
ncbi:phosphotransferase family protein [Halococcus salifodinae]|uniref:Phosphotransferase n=1 Tax=Halococcus salifodinae DSM 8989 TaxID=1227456 RepID=M0NCK6_9EURY|nr:aminoglycoside phosphotransferase family protein [Halococcus salifodinae]EMA55561.1 phosphotransferase [Halococcus salifodinae DSM 8989]